MTEKVIGEIRFIESDDGFRIEINGDKERLKEMGWGPGMMGPRHMGRGRKRFWRDRREMRHGHDPLHKHGSGHKHGHGCAPGGPWSWWGWGEDWSGERDAYEKPPKNV